MARTLILVVALGGALALGACISPLPQDPLVAKLQGTWMGCRTDTTGDLREEIAFSDRKLTWAVHRHPTVDGTCGGAETSSSTLRGSYVAGELLEATIGVAGEQVIAQGLDVTDATRSFYTTVYVNQSADPDALYLGDPDADPSRDTSSGAKRPIVLETFPLLKI